jgi:tetratricopeptide (TPR) repeat protein
MKKLLIILLLIAIIGGALMVATEMGESEWTTNSPEAEQELELGLAAIMKYYTQDAAEHFARALELDPNFVAAKLYLSSYEHDWERREAMKEELRVADLSNATPRERFLRNLRVAQWDRDKDLAHEIAEAYVEAEPHDPYGIAALAELFWEEQSWGKAEETYRRILEIDPNWVTAQNRLGYIAVAQGRFEEAEELFTTYTYIAPDQANPHDSMGELLVMVGRYEEARREFELALEIRPDFCNAYQHLIEAVLMEGELELGMSITEQVAEHCGERMASTLRCRLEVWRDFINGDSEAVWSDEREDCRRKIGDFDFLIHRTAVVSGRTKVAERTERGLKVRIEAAEMAEHIRLAFPRAILLHMQGTRLLAEGSHKKAVKSFEQADDILLYWGEGQGILKLYNQMNLARALERLGEDEASEAVLASVRAVNPSFADLYPQALGGI